MRAVFGEGYIRRNAIEAKLIPGGTMSTEEDYEERQQRLYREVTSDRLRDWLLKPENKHRQDEIEAIYHSYPDLKEAKRTAVKGLVLKELASLQGDPLKMELAMILVHLGVSMLDWNRLEDDLGL